MAKRPPRLAPVGKDMVAERLAWLHEKFPEAVRDGVLDPATLLAGLGVDVAAEGTERFGLSWPGKAACFRTLQARSVGTLLPMRAESVDFDTTGNVIVEGDNLEVLKLIQNAYVGQVKMIYIDPPYNTGGDFVYPDNYEDGLDEYLRITGQKDGDGRAMSALRETDGRFHSKWLSMMYPRLFLAKSLLRPDGVIFVSIDDNEVHRLRMVLDEVFGEENFVAQFVWSAGRKNDSKLVSVSHEYMLCYARDTQALLEHHGEWRQRKKGLDDIYRQYEKLRAIHGNDFAQISAEMKAWYAALPENNDSKKHRHYSSVDERGLYFPDNISWPGGGGPKYEVLHPVTGKPAAVPSRGWMFSKPERMKEMMRENRVHFGPDETYVPCIKSHLVDREYEVPYSVFYQDGRAATKRLRTLLDGAYFDHPKDETILKAIMEFATDKDSLVMDFFAGSGTTAQAVLELNQQDGGHRRFFLVQLPEPIENGDYPTIAHLTRERVRRVIDRTNAADAERSASDESSLFAASGGDENESGAAAPPDRGFRAFRLASSNFTVWDGRDPALRDAEALAGAVGLFAEHRVVAGRTSEDLFFEVLLRLGLPLTAPYEIVTLADTPVYSLEDGLILVCLAERIPLECVESMAERHPMQIVCAEAGLGGDEALVNAHETVKSIAREEDEDNDIGFQLV